MLDTPKAIVSRVEVKNRRRLIIIDDQPQMLGRFVKNFEALGYEVVPVIVSRGDIDQCFGNGRIDKKAVADEIARLQDEPSAWATLQQREALAHFEYGVRSKAELHQLLRELKPDLILSDERMRLERKSIASEEALRADDNVVCGSDVMQIAAMLYPNAPRAIHTAIYDAQIQPVPKKVATQAKALGHMVFAKDDYEDKEQPQAELIHDYFQGQLAKAHGKGPTPA